MTEFEIEETARAIDRIARAQAAVNQSIAATAKAIEKIDRTVAMINLARPAIRAMTALAKVGSLDSTTPPKT